MKIFILVFLFISFGIAHPTYTGYSGAPGSKGTCASSCHGSGTGTITVSGIPASYTPGSSYTVVVKHSGGSTISNFNASTRRGSTATGGGTFTAGTATTAYSVSGYENGIRASSNNIDSANFTWTAPSAGTGAVIFYIAGLQGSKSGQNTKVTVLSTEQSAAGVHNSDMAVSSFVLEQNYPNPFNPTTTISYRLPVKSYATLKIFDVVGKEIATPVNEIQTAGKHTAQFDASFFPSGTYFYTLRAGDMVQSRKMLLTK